MDPNSSECVQEKREGNVFIILFARQRHLQFVCEEEEEGAMLLHAWTSTRPCTDNILMSSPTILRGQSSVHYLQQPGRSGDVVSLEPDWLRAGRRAWTLSGADGAWALWEQHSDTVVMLSG